MPGLGTSFGRGGATTALQDLQNADAILIIGSSMAENHPVGFKWVIAARERGATVIHVDPRFTRTSAMADMWVPLRAGSDTVFLGAMVNYVLTHGLEFRDYVVAYTNAATIIDASYVGPEELEVAVLDRSDGRRAFRRQVRSVVLHGPQRDVDPQADPRRSIGQRLAGPVDRRRFE